VGLDELGAFQQSLYRLAFRVEECERRLTTLEAQALGGALPHELSAPLSRKGAAERADELSREDRAAMMNSGSLIRAVGMRRMLAKLIIGCGGDAAACREEWKALSRETGGPEEPEEDAEPEE
jgi:hypothetical protein